MPPTYLAPCNTHITRDSESVPHFLKLFPASREAASPGALGASLPAPSTLEESLEGTGTADDAPAAAILPPIKVKLEYSEEMEIDASSGTLPSSQEEDAAPKQREGASPGALGAPLPSPSKLLPLDERVTPPRKAARPFSLSSGTVDDSQTLPAKRQKVKQEREGSREVSREGLPGSCDAMEVDVEVKQEALPDGPFGASASAMAGALGVKAASEHPLVKKEFVETRSLKDMWRASGLKIRSSKPAVSELEAAVGAGPTTFVCNTVIEECLRDSKRHKALGIFKSMLASSILPDQKTVDLFQAICADSSNPDVSVAACTLVCGFLDGIWPAEVARLVPPGLPIQLATSCGGQRLHHSAWALSKRIFAQGGHAKVGLEEREALFVAYFEGCIQDRRCPIEA
ncbi:hypothetical protein T484DRAFT_1776396 [Baffinella frigidus]|nr:hypothetical protein T484DRAFT_1776396 [Cryptophyta sp. CCMP2293]